MTNPQKVKDFSANGGQVRQAHYDRPETLASLLADSDTGASKGGLFDDSHAPSQLIGRPTTPFSATVAEAI